MAPPRKSASDAAQTLKALSHPLRVQILGALEHEVKSPNELAKLLGAPLGNIAYHVRRLEALGLVKLVEQTPRRGAVEHYYKLEDRPAVAQAAWSPTPKVVRNALVGAVLRQVGEDVNGASKAGGFDRDEAKVSQQPLRLDAEGMKEAAQELAETAKRLEKIETASRKRLGKAEEGRVDAQAVLMVFESQRTPGRATKR